MAVNNTDLVSPAPLRAPIITKAVPMGTCTKAMILRTSAPNWTIWGSSTYNFISICGNTSSSAPPMESIHVDSRQHSQAALSAKSGLSAPRA
ncbi:MAG: hypothetical protein BWY85_02192 [Firmicutes bacterium ADurb.Bin506]|nr:MAG: hypothetical protein BWY85_02192 [Firmicutes bacterium ADurb.Bin506]